MEPLQVGVKNISVDQNCTVKAVNRASIAGKLQQFLVRQAVYQLRLLIADILSAQLPQLYRNFLHAFDGFIVVFHCGILLKLIWVWTEVDRERKKSTSQSYSKKCSLVCSNLTPYCLKFTTLRVDALFLGNLLSNCCQREDNTAENHII